MGSVGLNTYSKGPNPGAKSWDHASMEILSAIGLSTAAGLNAYIPLMVLGLLDRFTNLLTLPPTWAWISEPWVLILMAVLLAIEVIADKVPVVDSVNDVLQTVIRPASGGIVFASGMGSQTTTVTDPAGFAADSSQWLPIVIGIAIALVIHLSKASARTVANASTAGMAAPIASTSEDAVSLFLSVVAIIFPVIALIVVMGVFGVLIWMARGVRKVVGSARPQQSDPLGHARPEPAPDSDSFE